MNTPTELEDRLRRGLHAAAVALPPPGRQPGEPGRPPSPKSRTRWTAAVVGGIAAAAVVAAAVLVVDGDGAEPDVRLEPAEQPEPPDGTEAPDSETAEPEQPAAPDTDVTAANGMVPGQAVVVDDELRTYGPDGVQTGALSLAPLSGVQSGSSDLAGGWVACGMSASSSDDLVWFPAGGEPTVVAGMGGWCSADAVRVVDAPEGPTAIYQTVGSGQALFSYRAVVLATGEDRELSFPLDPSGFYRWSAATGRIAFLSDEGGLQLFDLATGESLPAASIDATGASDIVVSPDATSIAVLVGDVADGPSDLVVYDLASGAERYRESFAMSLEGAQLSYDGTRVAVGNFYDGLDYPPVTVIDLATRARHTIAVYGVVL